MKKFIALLLVAIMAITAVIPAMAAENNDETPATATAPDAPVFYGAQTRAAESKLADHSDVRFIATVSSTTGTCVGYEIVANYYEVGATEPAKTVTYTDTETESTTVYTSVLDNGETKTADELVDGAAYIFVVTLTDVPNAQSVDFTVTAYVEYNGEDISSTAEFQRYENGEIMVVNNAYSQDFNTERDAKADLDEVGVATLYAGATRPDILLVDDGKLNIPYLRWKECMLSLVSNSNLKNSVQNSNAYFLELDMEFDHIDSFGLILNGDCDSTSTDTSTANPVDAQNGIFVGLRYFNSSNAAAGKDIEGGEDLYFRFAFLDAAGATMPAGAKTENDKLAYTVPADTDIAEIKLGIAVHNLTSGCRVDLYINNVYITSYETTETEAAIDHWIKETSFVRLWAEYNRCAIEEIRLAAITNTETAPSANAVAPDTSAVANRYVENFVLDNGDLNYMERIGISRPITSKTCTVGGVNTNVVDNKLLVSWHTTHNETDEIVTLVDKGKIANGQTFVFEADFAHGGKTTSYGFLIADSVSNKADSNALVYNGFFVEVVSDTEIKVHYQDTNGTTTKSFAVTGARNARYSIEIDSTPANGTLIKVSIPNNDVITVYAEGNGFDANSNTFVALVAQNVKVNIDNITLKTYTAPIAA